MNAHSQAPAGINADLVSRWLNANVAGSVAPFHFDLIAGGHSNLTFSVTDSANHHYVLRRPPLSHALASAHDMGREHRVISALQNTKVPVAPTLAMCDDVSINDAPFYVMGFVDGIIVRDPEIASSMLTPATRLQASNSRVLEAFHCPYQRLSWRSM